MTIKSLLLGSAAALAAVSGAQAADAIIAAEPEPMEYVRVCDAFGTGYFYIPGTETCLKVGGYVRFQTNFDSSDDAYDDEHWNAWTRARLEVVAKSDTELGELTSFIAIHGEADNDSFDDDFYLDEVYIQLGGFKVGNYYNWWDKGINGETDKLGSNRFTSLAYIYTGEAFSAGIQLDEIEYDEFSTAVPPVLLDSGRDLGVEAIVSASFGAASFDLLGSYDFYNDEGAIRALVSADVGPGVLQLAGIWSSGVNVYYDTSEWTIAASYAFKATDRFTITPGVQYFDSYGWDAVAGDFSSNDAWRAGVTADYAITEGLALKATVNYNDIDNVDDYWDGFVRLQRSF